MSLFQVNGLNKKYVSGEVTTPVLKNVKLEIEKGEFVTILGPSGSGKTTLLNVLSGLDHEYSGEIQYNEQNFSKLTEKQLGEYRRQDVSLVFQQYYLLPTLTVHENTQVGKYLTSEQLSISTILEQVGLLEHKDKYPNQLSGGQKQRTAIARAIVKSPKIIFCDEPTGALDIENSKMVIQLLLELNKKNGVTIIMVTHHEAFSLLANRVIRMKDGKIEEVNITTSPLSIDEIEW
ncbi:MAG TPA: ABC transporter ATP-binding protein [Candidatus Paenibacillus intestinavium]|nr:ABC transporter ATP-binding protein [Candidatus Paenibacillus intestinavium]